VEAFWRFIFYSVFVVVGYYTLFSPEPAIWITDTKQHWVDWPQHPMSSMLQYYYLTELGAYLHQIMWTEIRRSDAAEMMLHHVLTIALIMASYLTNFTRIGASILMLHDVADIFLESAKIFNYIKYSNKDMPIFNLIPDILFGIFAVLFPITRLILYPLFILYSVFFEASQAFGVMWVGFWVFAIMLSILQCLHIFWFYLISKMIYKLLTAQIEKDERSDDDEDFADEYDGTLEGEEKEKEADSTEENKKTTTKEKKEILKKNK
jgi:ceramide synthetase